MPKRLDEEKVTRAIELGLSGASYAKAGALAEVHPASLHHRMARAGVLPDIGREIKANGDRDAYRAHLAQARAEEAARRPKAHWTESRPELWTEVCRLLRTPSRLA